jgi:LysM repeat protein
MNNEEPYRDQADRLKRRIEKINDKTEDGASNDRIPPREQVHRQKKKKTKWKLKYPMIRLLVLFFILLPIIISSVISYLDDKKMNGTEKTTGDSVGYEEINLEKPKKKVENTIDKVEEKTVTESQTGTAGELNEKKEDSNTQIQPDSNNTPDQSSGTNEAGSSVQVSGNSSGGQTETTTEGATPPAKTTKIIYHTVQPKETLYRIAMKYYNSKAGIDTIQNANHIQNNQIITGQVLKIPLNN